MNARKMRQAAYLTLVAGLVSAGMSRSASAAEPQLQSPPQVWADYDPNKGDFKEQIIKEVTKDGKYLRESYISAYVLGEEIRVYCQYKVKAGATNAPGLLNVHGWMAQPMLRESYIDEGWAQMAHDYCGQVEGRKEFTKYPEKFRHCNMSKPLAPPTRSSTVENRQITDAKETSDYVWYAIERRVLSYLEQQKEVDKSRLGAVGYSYGGTLMWPLATDPRIKAVAAYYGIGWLEYYRNKRVWLYNNPPVEPPMTSGEKIFHAGISPEAYVPYITAPTLFLNGSNDHHGQFERGLESFKRFKPEVPWAFAVQARGHHNADKIDQDTKMWLEKYVLNKDVFWPGHSKSLIELDGQGIPQLRVTPESPLRVQKVEIYYALKNPECTTRRWRDAVCQKEGNVWVGKMPVSNIDDYVFGYANIIYDTTAVISTEFNAAIPAKLGKAVATESAEDRLYTGDGSLGAWKNVAELEGVGGIKAFRCTDNNAGLSADLMGNPKWAVPHGGAKLGFKFYCTEPQMIILSADDWETELKITASDQWQEMVIPASKLHSRNGSKTLGGWEVIQTLHLKPKAGAEITKVLFAQFKWVKPGAK